jgi:hypothetical protein
MCHLRLSAVRSEKKYCGKCTVLGPVIYIERLCRLDGSFEISVNSCSKAIIIGCPRKGMPDFVNTLSFTVILNFSILLHCINLTLHSIFLPSMCNIS